ncbi:MAG: class I SAM-dependent methyltransferase [Methanothrix sp.]|nr:class I SAM-dependent methyltransferase [Methanothrix sp.]
MPDFSQDLIDHEVDQVYAPAEDTYLLLRAALAESRPEDIVLEIGCGSGILAQEVSFQVRRFIATDINHHALRATRRRAGFIDLVASDLFRGIKGRFDLILFNPPYLPTEPEEREGGWIDRALDGGESGRDTIDRFLRELKEHFQPGGRALLLISSLTGPDEVKETASSLGLAAEAVASERCFFEQLHVLRISARDETSSASRE